MQPPCPNKTIVVDHCHAAEGRTEYVLGAAQLVKTGWPSIQLSEKISSVLLYAEPIWMKSLMIMGRGNDHWVRRLRWYGDMVDTQDTAVTGDTVDIQGTADTEVTVDTVMHWVAHHRAHCRWATYPQLKQSPTLTSELEEIRKGDQKRELTSKE
ncbi:hypothetical protein KIN20_004911 [Parelaphostrongylus tenuis]|uniref:Uncharacterized protein n=1 Tax=Parelaphostrongylus tenuis TaxID=148309 RepID=A0AAD5MHL5_PARTN|nr:hypothetical protein KIN20_004911 [Parelaphostrongylus tenuis]